MARAARFLACTSFLLLLPIAPGCGGTPNADDTGTGSDDGGTDAAIDANRDAAPACRADTDCDDGLFCNGNERCMSGACVAGTTLACGDGVDCTRDFCSEDRRSCVHQVPDMDGDGHGAATCLDGTGVPLGDDCADDDAHRFPGNTEVCDAMHHDEDCVMTTHGNIDHDSDGFEDAACCNDTNCGTDCDDSNRSTNPSATEVCDHIDNNCDTHVDEGLGQMMFVDADRDGYGNSAVAQVTQCGDTVGYAVRGGDCDDMRVDMNPGQLEVCDTFDNDCDMQMDEDAGSVPWYVDADHDGYGDPNGATLVQCAPPTGSYSLVGTDCDDTTNARSPRAPEVCNALDDDCNGLADFVITRSDMEDDDHDHVADTNCGGALGHDCNDRDATAYPGAAEICNGRDDDCDAMVDEDATNATFHRDGDMDGYGDPGTAVIACTAPTGYVLDATDCDDAVVARHPGASETCNASDDDCDRRVDEAPAASSCNIPGAVAACTVGICHVASCQPGFSDCTFADGCETSTIADDNRCGSCTRACDPMLEQCVQSQCVPGGLDAIVGASSANDVGRAIDLGQAGQLLGGWFSGSSFGIGCGTHATAQGEAGIVSLRDSSGHCTGTLVIDGSGDEEVISVRFGAPGAIFVALTTTSTSLSIGGTPVNAGTGQMGRDVVIAQLDGSLATQHVWRFGGAFDDVVTDLAVDGTDVWAVGAMRGPATAGTQTLAATTTTDSVVIELDASTGNVLHLVSAPSTMDDGARAIELDTSNAYVAGTVMGSATFGSTPITAPSGDAYVWVLARSDASTTQVRAFGGGGVDVATGIAHGSGGGAALAVSGSFTGTITVDALNATSQGLTDAFVIGFDPSLAAQWLVPFGGSGDDVFNDVVDASITYVAVGTFTGMAHVGPGDAGVASSGGTDGVAIGVTSTGFTQGTNVFGGSGHDEVFSVATQGPPYLYLAGEYGAAWTWVESTLPSVGGLDAMWLQMYLPGG